MKTFKFFSIVPVIFLILSLNVFAAGSISITADTATKGNWVGKYGSDGYFMFAKNAESCVNNLPAYVSEFSYSDLFGNKPSYHQWWLGDDSDTSGVNSANAYEDALWTDKTKTQRVIPCIYNGTGLNLTIDVGSTETTVSIYSCDWGNDGRCVEVTAYDSAGNTLGTYDLTAFEHGTYLTATITGKVVFEYSYYDAINLGSPSNAVISAVFFDNAAAEKTEAAPEPTAAEKTEADPKPITAVTATDTDAKTETVITAAPQTFDVLSMAISGIIISIGAAYISKKNK